MRRSYAVAWGANAGRAELSERGLELTSRDSTERIDFVNIAKVSLTRGTLQIDALSLRSLDGPGSLRELADHLAARLTEQPGSETWLQSEAPIHRPNPARP